MTSLLNWGAWQVALLFAVAGTLVTFLYLLKQQRRRVVVPFAPLWLEHNIQSPSTRLLARMRRWLSLLLALVILGLMSVAVSDPRVGASGRGRALVVLLDGGLTMQSRDVMPSRFEAAKGEIARLLEQLGPSDRMSLVLLTDTATPLTPFTSDKRLLLRTLDMQHPSDVPTDLTAGLRTARALMTGGIGDGEAHEVVLVSDGSFASSLSEDVESMPEAVRLSYIPVGERGVPNLAITSLAMRRYPLDRQRSELLVELSNQGDETADVELTLMGDGVPVDVRVLRIAGGGSVRHLFDDVTGVAHRLTAQLRPLEPAADVLPADNVAYARVPPAHRTRVLSVTEGNRYLEAALLLDEYLEVEVSTPESFAKMQRPLPYDVLIFDRSVPERWPEHPAIYLGLAQGSVGFALEGRIERPFFERLREQDPLLRWVALRDVNIATAWKVALAPGDEAVGSDARGPLIVRGRRAEQPFVALTFDVRESDLPLRTAWPLFLLNAIDGFRRETAELATYRAGEQWHVPVPESAREVQISGPDGERWVVPVHDARLSFAASRAGFYHVHAGEFEDVVAVNPPAVHAGVPAPPLRWGQRTFQPPSVSPSQVQHIVWPYLVLAALLLLVAQWIACQRRWTV